MARRIIDTKTVREQLGDLLDQARYRGYEFVIQRRGKPLAALISYDAFERYHRQRKEAFKVFEEIWAANEGVDPDRVAVDAERAVAEVRRSKRQAGRKK